MARGIGRRTFLSGLGGAPAAVSSRNWIGLQKRIEETFSAELELRGAVAVWGEDEGFLVAGRTIAGVGLVRIDHDGSVAWRREDITEGGVRGSVIAKEDLSDGGYILLTNTRRIVRTDGEGLTQWSETVDPPTSVEVRDHSVSEMVAGPDESCYVAGSITTDFDGDGLKDDAEAWLRKYSPQGDVEWNHRPNVQNYSGDDSRRGVGLLAELGDGVRVGFQGEGATVGVLSVFDVAADGSIRNRFEREYDALSLSFRPAPSGYVGVLEPKRESSWGDQNQLVRTDESLAITSRWKPPAPGDLNAFVRLEGGDYLMATRDENIGDEDKWYLSRVASDGSDVWTKRTTGYGVAAAGGQFATRKDGRLVAFTERDGDTLDPVLGLAGLGLGLFAYGLAREGDR